MKRKSQINKVKGSLTLEAAIILPLSLVFLMLLVRFIQFRHAELHWWAAAEEAIQEVEYGLSFPLEDLLENNHEDEEVNTILEKVKDGVGAALLEQLHQSKFEDRTDHVAQLKGFLKPQWSQLTFDKGYYHYSSDYVLQMGRLSYQGRYTSAISVWSTNQNSSDTRKDKASSIWSKGNFERGKYFREKYGANLPYNFRTISRFESGNATMIRSLDLTAKSYQTESNLTRELNQLVSTLLDFNPTAKEHLKLGGPITKRSVLLIIPENSSHLSLVVLQKCIDASRARGVDIAFVMDQKSHRG